MKHSVQWIVAALVLAAGGIGVDAVVEGITVPTAKNVLGIANNPVDDDVKDQVMIMEGSISDINLQPRQWDVVMYDPKRTNGGTIVRVKDWTLIWWVLPVFGITERRENRPPRFSIFFQRVNAFFPASCTTAISFLLTGWRAMGRSIFPSFDLVIPWTRAKYLFFTAPALNWADKSEWALSVFATTRRVLMYPCRGDAQSRVAESRQCRRDLGNA